MASQAAGKYVLLLSAAALLHLAAGFGLCANTPRALYGTRAGKPVCGRFSPNIQSGARAAAATPRLRSQSRRTGRRALSVLRMDEQDVATWGTDEVVGWLEREGFNEQWTRAFRENEIDGEALQLLKDPSVLDDMDIPRMVGGRLKFWQKLDLIVPSSEPRYGSGTVSRAVSSDPADPAVAAMASAPEPNAAAAAAVDESAADAATTTVASSSLVEAVSVSDAAQVAGKALSAPMDSKALEALMTDEAALIDSMCELLADLDAKDRDVALLLDMKDRLKTLFSVVIVGEFNAGKSSLINAILGSRFCQEGVVPTTTTINMLRYGDGEESGQIQRNKDYLELFLPVPLLRQVTIVDTPGTNAIIKEQTRLTKGFIPQSDLVIFVTSAERPVTETEGKLLSYISEWGKKVVMVLNKVDLFEDAESQRKVTAFVEENGSRILGATPPVFGVAGRLALNSKLKRAAGDTAAADELWTRSQFAQLEDFVVTQLTDKKEAAKVKLMSPLGVAERFLQNYEKASSLGGKITADDKAVLVEIKDSLEAYEKDVVAALELKLDKLDAVMNKMQGKVATTTNKVLSGGYIASNLLSVLSKNEATIASELKMALDLDLNKELEALAEDFARQIQDKQDAQWNLCSALITQRLNSRGWREITLTKPDLAPIVSAMTSAVMADAERSKRSARFDPAVETVMIGQAVSQKAYDVAVATVAVAGSGLLGLEVFDAGVLDALAFLGTGGGLAYSLGVYPAMMQDQVAQDVDARAKGWRDDLRDEVRALLVQAARDANFEMEQAFAPYVDAVSVEADKWESVGARVERLSEDLGRLRERIDTL